MSEINPLLTLCAAAEMVKVSASHDPVPPLKETDEDPKFPVKLNLFERCLNPDFSIGSKPSVSKISNAKFDRFAINTSNELSKKFSYECKYCSKVFVSYGSEKKARYDMWTHIVEQHPEEKRIHQSTKLKRDAPRTSSKTKPIAGTLSLDATSKMSPKSSINVCSEKPVKTISAKRSKRGKSTFQDQVKKSDTKIHENDDCTDFDKTTDTLKLGQFEHGYAKSPHDEPHTVNPSVHEAGENKKQKKENYDLSTMMLILKTCYPHVMPPVISTPPFPYVYTPYPLETAQIVELHSNGDPIDWMKSISSGNGMSSMQAAENRSNKKKVKCSPTINASRSVLECVENRVSCKPDTSTEEKEARGSDNSIENSENVEKSVEVIAKRNIHKLSHQGRKKKKSPKRMATCEICFKQYTALTSLKYHYMGHLNLKPFQCKICSNVFTRRHSLNYHYMIHANKNRFQCPTCNKLFRHPSHYKEHLRKHTGEEPYSCKFCPNKFKTRNSFKRHLKMQHQKLLTSKGIVSIDNDN